MFLIDGSLPCHAERIDQAAELLSDAFRTDPLITYFLGALSKQKRLAYLPAYFTALLTAAALNGATFEEVHEWASCAVLVPPGHKIDNWMTVLPAGFMGVLWNLGVTGCLVS